jgi:DNA replication and repair protein RecF
MLEKLDIYSLRNIQRASLNPSPVINLIIGENASGKSSLLEAIYILGRGRSFRATNIKQVIQFSQSELVISGKARQQGSHLCHLGIKFSVNQCDIRINHENKGKAELAQSLPILLIHPKSYVLLDGGPQVRREFLDWGVFNQPESDFLIYWRRFKKTLQQRNALLKRKQYEQVKTWNTELVQYGTIVSHYRHEYLKKLQPIFIEVSQCFFSFEHTELHYASGWGESNAFDQALINDFEKDIKYGFTHSGPHRSDFKLLINGRLAKDFVSRGQLKLLILALKLAQVKLINNEMDHSVCILIDDLTAELDQLNKQILLGYLVKLNCQVFISSTELSNFGELSQLKNYKVFHVEHGEIKCIDEVGCST